MMSGLPNAMRTVAVVFAVSAAFLAACDSRPTELRLVAPSSPLDLEITQNLKALLDRDSDFRLDITMQQHSGEAALDMLLAGKADICCWRARLISRWCRIICRIARASPP